MTLFRTFVFDCDLSDFEPDSLVFENGAPCRTMLEILTHNKKFATFYQNNVKNIICQTENILLIEEIANFLAA